MGHQMENGETQRTSGTQKQRGESHFQKQKDFCPPWFPESKPQHRPAGSGGWAEGVSGSVLWRLSAGTFPTSASARLRTHPSAQLAPSQQGVLTCADKKNLLTCRKLGIFRFREKTLKNLSPQPVFPFPLSLLSPPLDEFSSLAVPSLRFFRIYFANLGI